jgi:hypothetical protein
LKAMQVGAQLTNTPNIPNLWTNRKEREYY